MSGRPPGYARRISAVAMVAAVVALPACEMRIELATTVAEGGSGSFAVTVEMDRDFLDGIEALAGRGVGPGVGVEALEGFFEDLGDRGWEVRRERADGGLLLAASRPFADSGEFEGVLGSLRGELSGDAEPLAGLTAELDFEVRRTLFRSSVSFGGAVDLTGEGLSEDLLTLLEIARGAGLEVVTLEIAADLPGAVSIEEGNGRLEGRRAVWSPRPGERLVFAASASRLRAGPLLGVALPVVLGLGLLGWILAGRRRRAERDLGGFTPRGSSGAAPDPSGAAPAASGAVGAPTPPAPPPSRGPGQAPE